MIVVVTSKDINVHTTRSEIGKDAVEVLAEMTKKVGPNGIKLSLEFVIAPTMTINRFDDAYEIMKEIDFSSFLLMRSIKADSKRIPAIRDYIEFKNQKSK